MSLCRSRVLLSIVFCLCAALSLLPGAAAAEGGSESKAAIGQAESWAVGVLAYRDDELLNQVSGFVAGSGDVVVTVGHIVEQATRIEIVFGDGSVQEATVLARSPEQGIALLQIVPARSQAATLASGLPVRGDSVHSVGMWVDGLEPERGFHLFGKAAPEFQAQRPTELKSAVGVVQKADDAGIVHVSQIGRGGYGAPVINRCGQVAGMNVPALGKTAEEVWKRHVPEPQMLAVSAVVIAGVLKEAGFDPNVATRKCLGAVAEAQKRADEADKKAQEAEKQAKEAEEEKKRAKEEKKRAEEDAEEARKGKEGAEKEAERTREEAAEATEALAERIGSEQGRLAEFETMLKRHKYALLGGGIVALIVIVWIIVMLRRRQRALSASEAALADLEAPKRNYVLSGTDSNGGPIAVRVFGRDFHEKPGGLLVGRNPNAVQVVIADETVSRVHAKLRLEDGRIYIEDYGSSTGTSVHGAPVQPGEALEVANGDEIRLGEVTLIVEFEEPKNV